MSYTPTTSFKILTMNQRNYWLLSAVLYLYLHANTDTIIKHETQINTMVKTKTTNKPDS